jgi:hypothetical protein
LLRRIGKMSYRVQAKSKDVDFILFHSGLIRMLVSEELGKKEISWERFVVTSHFKLNLVSTPQSQIVGPLSPTSTSKAGTNRKRKGRTPIQVLEIIKQVIEAEEQVCPSSHRHLSPPPPPGLEEVPSSTKATSKKGKKLLFPSSPPVVEIKGKRTFTRSTIPKDFFKEQSLPKPPIQNKGKRIENLVEEKSETLIQRKKGKGSSHPTERKQEILVHKGKDKGTKRPLESKYETSEKGTEKPIERKYETHVLRKKNKSKFIKEPDEADKPFPMEEEEESEKKPSKIVHVIILPDSQTYKRLIKQLIDARK